MKKWTKQALSILLSAAIGVNGPFAPPAEAEVFSPPYVSGIFIAPELSSDATADEWEESLQKMADIGVDTVIVQYSFQSDSAGGNQAYFDYWQQDTVADTGNHPFRRSQIGWVLAAAKKAGMQVYLGLQIAEREWFDANGYRNYDWLYHHYWLSTDLANALWNAFGGTYADTIAGWYLPFEFESTEEYQSYFSQLTQVYYGPTTTYLKSDSRFGHLPIMISPLMYWDDNKNNWLNNLQTVLSGSQIDILAPQDGIGYGTQTHATVGDWYRVCRDAVDTVNRTGKTVQLWGNCENYARLRNPNEPLETERIKPMSIRKFIDSMYKAAPYVEKLITFSIHRWDTVQYHNRTAGVNRSYYESYKRYYQTGICPANIADGYYVSIQPAEGAQITENPYADAGLTDGFASGTGWDQFKGIASGRQPFTMEIRFDDPVDIAVISSHYYQENASEIALPQQVVYEYMVRSGDREQILSYTEIERHTPVGSDAVVLSAVSLPHSVKADGIRITVTPGGKWTFIDDIEVLADPYTSSHPVTGSVITVPQRNSTASQTPASSLPEKSTEDSPSSHRADPTAIRETGSKGPILGNSGLNITQTISDTVPSTTAPLFAGSESRPFYFSGSSSSFSRSAPPGDLSLPLVITLSFSGLAGIIACVAFFYWAKKKRRSSSSVVNRKT